MAKEVFFKNSVTDGYFEEVEYSEEVFVESPKFFQNENDGNAELALVDPCAMLYENGDFSSKPFYYFRHALIDESRFGGIVELGDSYLDYQIKGDTKGIFQRGVISDPYHKKSKDNEQFFEYGFGTKEPFSEFRFHPEYQTWKEADALDLKATHIGKVVIDHQASFENLPQVFYPVYIEGSYREKKVEGLGFLATNYKPKLQKAGILDSLGYIAMWVSGIREDGRLEHAFIAIDQSGVAGAYYKIEGEDLISSKEVSMETTWEYLPYVDDGTCIYKDAIFRFAGKEIHFIGEWGTKGAKEKPYIEKHGQSHILGTWYEGSTPYKHKVSFGFGENMEAFDYKLEALGFEVKKGSK